MAGWYDEQREAQARAYELAHARLFLLRFALLFALAAAFWGAGWSRALAAGLHNWFSFPYAWPLICAVFTALAVFGYEAVLFPLSVLADFTLERLHGRHHLEFGAWLRGFIKTVVLEIAIVTAGFTVLYVLMRLFPAYWWLAAAGGYALLVAGLGEWGTAWLLPRVRKPAAIDDAALVAELRRIGAAAGLEITGAAWWDFEHQESLIDVCLAGTGRRRRVVFSARAWRERDRGEQLFLAARQMAWLGGRTAHAALALQIVLAGGVFRGAAWLTERAARAGGLAGATAPAAFPFLVVALFALAAAAGVVAHAAVRRGELRADGFALRHAGGAAVLEASLRREFEREPYAVDLPAWTVALLRREPTAARRLAAARKAGSPPPAG